MPRRPVPATTRATRKPAVKKAPAKKTAPAKKNEGFRALEHTADVKYETWGPTIDRAFAQAGIALFSTLLDVKQVKSTQKAQIRITAPRLETLLYDFLQELLFLHETTGILVSSIPALKITKRRKENEEYQLDATLRGDDYRKYDVHGAVKSATYSEMELSTGKHKSAIIFVLDI